MLSSTLGLFEILGARVMTSRQWLRREPWSGWQLGIDPWA